MELLTLKQDHWAPRLAATSSAAPSRPSSLPGHYDVQPAEDTAPLWTSPPFKPEIRFDRFWGRGVHDDKGSGVLPPLQASAGDTLA